MKHDFKKTKQRSKTLFLVLICVFAVFACNKNDFSYDRDATLEFSTDTVTFDTVFTSIGSATLAFKLYNTSRQAVRISSISLGGGQSSFFRLNIDGEPVSQASNVDVPPDDSLFIFVAVTIDPTNSNNPMVIKDSVIFLTNGTYQDVKLIAYGQDVHLINGEIIGTQTWSLDKPYLIYNSMAVDTGEVLTIEAGVQVYFHRRSSMIVWGTLLVNGTQDKPVIFQNDRLEEYYRVFAGQWGTIYIDPISKGNFINHAVIRNSIAGIQIGYPSDYNVPDLQLSNSTITNVSFAGIYAFGANITCYNSVISNCAGAAAALLRGGRYRFMQCTISNNGVIGSSRSSPSVVLSNVFYNPEYDENSGNYVYVERKGDLEEAGFYNCIVDGILSHELQLANNQINLFNYKFDHCLLKANEDSVENAGSEYFSNIILNEDPNFMNDSDRYHLDYRLDTLSPAKDAGDPGLLILYPYLQTDQLGNFRNLDAAPDLGAIERKED
jgi:hypothetical protein